MNWGGGPGSVPARFNITADEVFTQLLLNRVKLIIFDFRNNFKECEIKH